MFIEHIVRLCDMYSILLGLSLKKQNIYLKIQNMIISLFLSLNQLLYDVICLIFEYYRLELKFLLCFDFIDCMKHLFDIYSIVLSPLVILIEVAKRYICKLKKYNNFDIVKLKMRFLWCNICVV